MGTEYLYVNLGGLYKATNESPKPINEICMAKNDVFLIDTQNPARILYYYLGVHSYAQIELS
jgi:hypothetical protein